MRAFEVLRLTLRARDEQPRLNYQVGVQWVFIAAMRRSSGVFKEREVGSCVPTWLLSAKSMWPLASFRAVAKRRRNATGQKLLAFR